MHLFKGSNSLQNTRMAFKRSISYDFYYRWANKVKLSHGNLAYVMIILFINIKLLMIDNYLSKGFPSQLHEALCKCVGMIFA